MQCVFLGSVSWYPKCRASNVVALLEMVVDRVQSMEAECVLRIIELRLFGLFEDSLDGDSEASVLGQKAKLSVPSDRLHDSLVGWVVRPTRAETSYRHQGIDIGLR